MAMAARAVLLLALSLLAMAAAASAHGGYGSCPRDGLNLKACVDVLGKLKVNVNQPRYEPCCSLLDGLVGLDAALCLCTELHVGVLDLPVDIRLILNNCGKVCPTDFRCPPCY